LILLGSTGVIIGSPTLCTASITNVGSGWYRCAITYTQTSVTSAAQLHLVATLNAAGDFVYTGDGTSGIFVWGAMLETGVLTEYIPTTSGSLSVGITDDVPRVDYSGGGCPSLLLEGQRTNLVTFSEQFDNAYWAKTNITITANNAVSPDGFQNADTCTVTGGGNAINGSATSSGSNTITFSVFAKAGTQNVLRIREAFYFGTSTIFDLLTGTVTSGTGTITSYGNGWYRCTHTQTYGAGEVNVSCTYDTTASSGTFILYGAEFEVRSPTPQSYIPTYGVSSTRVADSCSKTGISELIGQSEGTLFAEIDLNLAGSNVGFYALQVYDSASSPTFSKAAYIELYQGKVYGYVRNTTIQCEIISSTYADNTRLKIAIAYKANDFALYVNGVQIGTDTSGSLPSVLNSLALHYSASSQQASPLYQAILFPTRLTNDQLADLTTL
jgi:hypothetical protein